MIYKCFIQKETEETYMKYLIEQESILFIRPSMICENKKMTLQSLLNNCKTEQSSVLQSSF